MKMIPLTEEQIHILKPYVESGYDAEYAFQEAARWMRVTHSDIWEKIHQLYPDCRNGNLDWKNHVLIVDAPKKEKTADGENKSA